MVPKSVHLDVKLEYFGYIYNIVNKIALHLFYLEVVL